jgi:lipopolysaccharide/colanic/teichoic acid biosynthesis glycosyltransferase
MFQAVIYCSLAEYRWRGVEGFLGRHLFVSQSEGSTMRKATAKSRKEETSDVAMRTLDIVVASIGMLLSFPVMLAVSMAILIETGRPIFYSQLRLGKRGRKFYIYKFRKFNEKKNDIGRALTVKEDNRMTRLGHLLQESKLDELPQLWNILRGDMSVVGPRPESLSFSDCFVDDYVGVLDFKPGIFGPNQVFFRNEGSIYSETAIQSCFIVRLCSRLRHE